MSHNKENIASVRPVNLNDTNLLDCSICGSEFDLMGEGGTNGYFGICPVSFCPWCLSCMIDMVRQFDCDTAE
jgi:hypothetical protein